MNNVTALHVHISATSCSSNQTTHILYLDIIVKSGGYTKKRKFRYARGVLYSISMTQKQIIEKVHGLKTKIDLLRLLNELKREDLGKDCHPFTLNQINFYCNPNNVPQKRYKEFTIPKKSGGVRRISAPRGSLKLILSYLNVIFQAMYKPTDAAMGFVPGRSIVDNASAHTGRNYVFNTDLKDFFPSIHQARVWKILQLKPFSFNREIASLIAGLSCMQDPNGTVDKKGMIIGVLPQGSPCSPILTNIVCRNLDKKLLRLAKGYNIKYTRYADDITFSSDYNVFQEDSKFMAEFIKIVADEKFEINDKKTRLQKSGQRQEVTGLLVNKKVNVAKEYHKDLRSLLYIWERYGHDQAYAKFCIRYRASKAYKPKKNNMPNMPAVISGKLLYMKMVMGERSSTYITLRDRFLALCPEQKAVLDTNLTYLASYRLDEFESSFNTEVVFSYKPESGVTGRSKTMGHFMLDSEKHLVSVNIRCDWAIDQYLATHEASVPESLKKQLYITLAERGNARFWLITRALMNNEHPKSFSGSYKAKIRVGEAYYQDINVADYLPETLEDEFGNPSVAKGGTTDTDDHENFLNPTIESEDIDDAMVDIDACLSAFVNSGFDFKTLEQWDKIKKN